MSCFQLVPYFVISATVNLTFMKTVIFTYKISVTYIINRKYNKYEFKSYPCVL